MATIVRPAKAKAAERVIEVLDYFDEQHREATVMDIARRYARPQSSTSELLASLVDLGLLYKDAGSRTYTLTPRAAILGSLSQPRMVRDGRLAQMVDEARAETGLGVALIGMVRTNVQIFRWKPGLQRIDTATGSSFVAGAQDRLFESAAGWLLLSTLTAPRRDGLLRRLNAEADIGRKFNPADMGTIVRECGRLGYATGPAGFGIGATITAVLLPGEEDQRPMAIGLMQEATDRSDPATLAGLLGRLVQRFAAPAYEAIPTSIAA